MKVVEAIHQILLFFPFDITYLSHKIILEYFQIPFIPLKSFTSQNTMLSIQKKNYQEIKQNIKIETF